MPRAISGRLSTPPDPSPTQTSSRVPVDGLIATKGVEFVHGYAAPRLVLQHIRSNRTMHSSAIAVATEMACSHVYHSCPPGPSILRSMHEDLTYRLAM